MARRRGTIDGAGGPRRRAWPVVVALAGAVLVLAGAGVGGMLIIGSATSRRADLAPPPAGDSPSANQSPAASSPSPYSAGAAPSPSPASPSTTPSAAPPAPLSQPTPADPLTILDIGDSLGEDLGIGLGIVLGSDADVRVIKDAVGDTGLARPDYYDWPAALEQELQADHPGLVVVMLGGNDTQSFDAGGQLERFGSPGWQTVYTSRVDQILDESAAAGTRVLWVGMPIMRSPQLSAGMATLNAIYSLAAADHPGVEYVSSWAVLSTPSGAYSSELPDAGGDMVLARDPDGIHIATSGAILLARAAVAAVDADWSVKI